MKDKKILESKKLTEEQLDKVIGGIDTTFFYSDMQNAARMNDNTRPQFEPPNINPFAQKFPQ